MNAVNDDFSIINDTMAKNVTKTFINEYPQIIETIRALNSKVKIISSTFIKSL